MAIQNWFKKIQELMFQKDESSFEDGNPKTFKGRLEADGRNTTPKMITHYPKQGKFRFPLIEDGEQKREVSTAKPKKSRTSRQQERSTVNEETHGTGKQREKFTGTQFKARDIPSPVYGYKQREKESIPYLKQESIQFPEIHLETSVVEEDKPFSAYHEDISSSTVEVPETTKEKVQAFSEELLQESWKEAEESKLVVEESEDEEIRIIEKEEMEELTVQEKPYIPKKRSQTEDKPQLATVTQPKKSSVPFNVLMLPSDKQKVNQKKNNYEFPTIQLLAIPPRFEDEGQEWLHEQSKLLEVTLQHFNVNAKVVHVTKGPSVTRFEIQPAPGVKVSKITGLTDDIKLSLAAKDIRMEAPIPGKNAIGIEVPNMVSKPVFLREIIRRREFQEKRSPLTVALGLDISGQPVITDLNKMPHGLVAGATGSGKSVCINSILISLLYKATPSEVKLLLIDPKMVELAPYNELPHLVTPVITDAKQATAALKWVVLEMERRYELFSQRGARDISRYNDLYSEGDTPALPYIVVVIDELADLMMVSPQDVEDAICRIAQKARACGIHLLLATQRPSVDVITGLIKANVPTRIAFSVSSQVDSRTIIDMSGAERLLGKGDMLFHENGTSKPIRVQGTFVSDDEIEQVLSFVKEQMPPDYILENEHLVKVQEGVEQEDELFEEACYFAIEQEGASASSLQRRFRIGYNRAARLIDMMEAQGIVSEAMGSKPRNVLVSIQDFEDRFHEADVK
ncbi:DNA translocase FtsK [Alkalihalobacterium bogoriense]|uniref:DNA translocase FtsK n=1 Tax=Alkalihalobacterium bogoriense TaxID=246272 RepID=UPI00054EA949|nr:DNA translocase FtsK [Alkalihalobacterium bogoriense]